MGLHAYVPCNCFREGKTKTPPPTQEELYIDEYGSLRPVCYRNIPLEELENDDEYRMLSYELLVWRDHACEHEEGNYIFEFLGDISVARDLTWVASQFPEGSFPFLIDLIPDKIGGSVPVKDAPEILRELAELRKRLPEITSYFLVDVNNGRVLYEGFTDDPEGIIFSGNRTFMIGFDEDGLFVMNHKTKELLFKAKEVMETIVTDDEGQTRTLWTDVSNPKNQLIINFGVPISEQKDGVGHLKVVKRPIAEDDVYIIEQMERLFKASIETGNPVFWA